MRDSEKEPEINIVAVLIISISFFCIVVFGLSCLLSAAMEMKSLENESPADDIYETRILSRDYQKVKSDITMIMMEPGYYDVLITPYDNGAEELRLNIPSGDAGIPFDKALFVRADYIDRKLVIYDGKNRVRSGRGYSYVDRIPDHVAVNQIHYFIIKRLPEILSERKVDISKYYRIID